MTQDEIIEMARDTANHGTHASGEIIYTFYLEQLVAFATLVAAKEREALAQHDSVQAKPEPEQEPVANYCKECLTYNGHHEGCSHYTTPPQRTWVGLTDEEMTHTNHHMVEGAYQYSFKQGAKWAEAKLKERNT